MKSDKSAYTVPFRAKILLCLNKKSPLAWCTMCRQTFERPSRLLVSQGKYGRILRHLHAMNSFAGLPLPRSRKRESAGLRQRSQS